MKNKQIANLIMVAVIVVIVISGVLCVGTIQGWFDSAEDSALLTEVRGIVNLERDGVAFAAEGDTVLREGDKISCTPGATALIRLDTDSWITVGEKAELTVADAGLAQFTADISAGEIFTCTSSMDPTHEAKPVTLRFDGKEIRIDDGVAALSVRSGAQSVSVYWGRIEHANAGEGLHWIRDEVSVDDLVITDLNAFTIAQLRRVHTQQHAWFTADELDQLEADREAQRLALLQKPEETQPEESAPVEMIPATDYAEETPVYTDAPVWNEPVWVEPEVVTPYETEPIQVVTPAPEETTAPQPEATQAPLPETVTPPVTQPPVTEPPATEPPATEPPATEPPATEPPATEPPVTEPPVTEPPVTEKRPTCTISIRCDTVLNNMDALDPAKAPFIPADGWILWAQMEFTDGESVFDILARACSAYGIQLEYSWTPIYDSYYIEGINNLYEFDCGAESGWMFKVNGWFPNYGCSSYTVSDGDSIEWHYSCIGLGSDLGA